MGVTTSGERRHVRDEVEAAHARRQTLNARSLALPSGCVIWTGSVHPKGYGQIGRHGYMFRTHRLAWVLVHGAIPEGMQVDHVCFNRRCLNVDHLRVVTPKQNQEYRMGANANNRSTGVRGVQRHKNGRYKAKFCHGHHQVHVGTFDTLEEAAEAVAAARAEAYGRSPDEADA